MCEIVTRRALVNKREELFVNVNVSDFLVMSKSMCVCVCTLCATKEICPLEHIKNEYEK